MSKYRRISTNNENKDKKVKGNTEQSKPSYLDTKTLMEKLGIKISNAEIYNKNNTLNTKKTKEMNNITTSTLNNNEDNNLNGNNLKSTSKQKRNKNDKKKINISSSYEKRDIKKDKIKKNNDNSIIKRDKIYKSKKNVIEMTEFNDINYENISNVKRKTVKREILKKDFDDNKTNKNNNHDTNKKNRKPTIKQEPKMTLIKGNKGQEEIKKTSTIKRDKNMSAEKIQSINNTFIQKTNYDYKNEEILNFEEEEEIPKKIKDKKPKDIEDIKEKEKRKNFRKNKARSAEKITDSIFDFESKKLKNKNKNESSIGFNRDSDSDSGENNDSDDLEDKTIDMKNIIRSNKRHLTEVGSQNEKKETIEKKDTNEKKDTIIEKKDTINDKNKEEKEVERSNKKHITEIPVQSDIIEEQKMIIRSNKKHLTEIGEPNRTHIQKKKSVDIDKEKERKFSRISIIKRQSVDNPMIRNRFENLMNQITLKQNGGNTLYLKNFEKGPGYQKEFEIRIKNQNIKKNLKINSCTKAGCSGPGIVKTNQDAYFVKENFLKNENYIFIGVCDGHGEKGEVVSKYVTNKLPEYIQDLSNENIINAFKKINNEIYNNKNIESNMSGTTVASIILTPEKIICPNLGDSRAVLFKYESGIYYSKNLSRDHKPGEPDENRRIINNNGRVKKCYDEELKKFLGPDRVWLKSKEEPGLAMSRSIGDKLAHTVGVSDEPEIKSFEYDGSEKFLIVASDGIWEYLHGEDCIKIVRPFYEDDKNCEEAALALVKEAFRKWKRKEVVIDDITVIIVFFNE